MLYIHVSTALNNLIRCVVVSIADGIGLVATNRSHLYRQRSTLNTSEAIASTSDHSRLRISVDVHRIIKLRLYTSKLNVAGGVLNWSPIYSPGHD